MTNIQYLKENNLYEAHKHFMRLAESYVGFPEDEDMIEDADDPNQDPNAMADPNAAGGMNQNAMGGDPNAMADPNAAGGMDPNAMGGDPNQAQDPNAMADPNMMGADPNAMGGGPIPDASAPMDDGTDPFADQRGGEDASMEDGEVIDIDGLTKAQEKLDVKQNQVGRDLSKVDNRIIKLIDTIQGLQDKLDNNNSQLEALKAEFEKRNPTQTEKLDMRGALDSYPFNVRPDDFWTNKMKERSNYGIYADNNKSTEDQYAITADDLDNIPSDISKSFSIPEDDIQTLEKIFNF